MRIRSFLPNSLKPLNNLNIFKLGNILCLVVMLQKKLRKHSAFVYLAFLSMVDIFVLVFGLGDIVIIAYFRYYIRNENMAICRIHSFLTYVFTHCSSFILALVSIDRAICTNMINFAKTYCRPEMAIRITGLTVCLSIIINFHNLLFLGHLKQVHNSTNSVQFECASKEGTLYEKFMDPYFEWVDLICYSLLPFVIMAVCSFLIIKVLFRSAKRLNKNKSHISKNKISKKASSSKSKPESHEINLLSKEKPTNSIRTNPSQIPTASSSYLAPSSPLTTTTPTTNHQIMSKSFSKNNKTRHLSYTLITLNVIFFILISPLVIVRIIIKEGDMNEASKIIINTVYLLAYSNHSLNFFLYGFSSPPFRNGVIQLFTRKRKDQPNFNTVLLKCDNYEMDEVNSRCAPPNSLAPHSVRSKRLSNTNLNV